MRRISILLVPLFVVLLQAAAYAGMHWGGKSGDFPPLLQAALGLGLAAVVIAVLAFIIKQPPLAAGTGCAIFVAVASVATMILVVEYVLIFLGPWVPTGWLYYLVLAILNILALMSMVRWAGLCCLGQAGQAMNWADAFKIVWIPALLAVAFSWIF